MVAILTEPEDPISSLPREEISRSRWWWIGALAVVVCVWLSHVPGLVSSNDGSHLALARALALHHQTSIGVERALTLEVDLAERDGLAYSDRPPGTAFAALPAARIGARLDRPMYARAVRQAKAGAPVDPLPGPELYLLTYAKRAGPGSPPLVELIGTSIVIGCHAVLVGLLGLMLVERGLRRLAFGDDERMFAVVGLALASAWGPYSTVLFSHGSAAAAVAGFSLGALALAQADAEELSPAWWIAPLTGLAGAWAIACDYLLLLAIVPAALLVITPRRYLAVLAGTLPIVLATFAYHHAAFGSVLSVGYDYQTNFEFARGRDSTFSGDLVGGLWTLLGAGRGAGLLVLAPLILLGVLALPVHFARGSELVGRRVWSRLSLAFVPWLLVLAMHRTPWGGGTEDHRYLIPLLPLVGAGLAQLWRSLERPLWRGFLVLLALASALVCWSHFLAWHEAEPFSRVGLGLAGGVCVLAVGVIRRKLWP